MTEADTSTQHHTVADEVAALTELERAGDHRAVERGAGELARALTKRGLALPVAQHARLADLDYAADNPKADVLAAVRRHGRDALLRAPTPQVRRALSVEERLDFVAARARRRRQ